MKCSFCGLREELVRKIIEGPDVAICDECVQACTDVLFEEKVLVNPPESAMAEDGAMTLEEWHEGLFDLYRRLSQALLKDRKQIDCIRVALSIDDVVDICTVIEDQIGPDWFKED